MTDYITKLLDRFVKEKEQKQYRQPETGPYAQAEIYSREGLSDLQRSVKRLQYMLENEKPHV